MRQAAAASALSMRERPILFSAPMVRAILEGRKTQTRRLVRIDDTPVLLVDARAGKRQRGIPTNAVNVRLLGQYVKCDAPPGSGTVSARVPCPYGMPGDRLWVRETLRQESDAWIYEADRKVVMLDVGDHRCGAMIAWAHHKEGDVCVSIHMPRWASRITLELTGVRVERLQDISEEDARAEGVTIPSSTIECPCEGPEDEPRTHLPHCRWRDPGVDPEDTATHRIEYAILWNQINGKRAPWSSNPWVWCLSFKRVAP